MIFPVEFALDGKRLCKLFPDGPVGRAVVIVFEYDQPHHFSRERFAIVGSICVFVVLLTLSLMSLLDCRIDRMQLVRSPSLPPPATPSLHPLPKLGADDRLPVIRINHPGYPPPNDELTAIPAVDPLPNAHSERRDHAAQVAQARPEEEDNLGPRAPWRQDDEDTAGSDVEVEVGVHHGTLLTICGIIADNAFEWVFLSHDPDGRCRVDERWQYDDILPAGEY